MDEMTGCPDNLEYSLYHDVLKLQAKFGDILTSKGAWEFNEAFETPMILSIQEEIPALGADVIDATLRKTTDWFGVESTSVEYLIKVSVKADTSKIRIVGKRFSELCQLHQMIFDLELVNKNESPPFPDRNDLHDNWWLLADKDPSSDFVKQRKLVLGTYISTLFRDHAELPFHPSVMDFFGINELCSDALLIRSQATFKRSRYNRQPHSQSISTSVSAVVSSHVQTHVRSREQLSKKAIDFEIYEV